MASFWLEYDQNGSRAQYPFENRSSVTFGRDKSVDFVLDHPTVSRQHASILYAPPQGYVLRVLSRGGLTAVDGNQVSGDVVLRDGNVIHMGQFSFTFRASQAAAASAPPLGGYGASAGGSFGASGGMAGAGAGGFGPSTPSGGFGAQAPASGGFGAQAPASGGFGAAGGFGGVEPPAKPKAKNSIGAGTVWDEIASSDEAQVDTAGARQVSDFERMQRAEQKTDQKTNPLLIVAVVIALAGMAYLFLSGPGDSGSGVATGENLQDAPPVEVIVSCVGEEDCIARARDAYKVGLEMILKKDANVTNLFDGWRKLYESKVYLAKVNAPVPADMNQLEAKEAASRAELDAVFRNYKVVYFRSKQRKMYREMADALMALKSYFPDKTSREYKFAAQEEVNMRSTGVYPSGRR